MKKLILASNNKKKVEEIKYILKDIDLEVKSLNDEGINVEVIEDGETFKENSNKKAREIREYLIDRGDTDFIVMADDSGLEVNYLNGEPGVYSARYAGKHGNDAKNNEKLLKNLQGVPYEKRGARFVCHVTLMNYEGKSLDIKGEVKGIIVDKLDGDGGFGYDPLFYNEILNKTFGEASKEEKNSVSHRGMALKELKEKIYQLL